jgi:hypothetical protein
LFGKDSGKKEDESVLDLDFLLRVLGHILGGLLGLVGLVFSIGSNLCKGDGVGKSRKSE